MAEILCGCGHRWQDHFHNHPDRRYCLKCSCWGFHQEHGERCACAKCTLHRLQPIDDPLIHQALEDAGIYD